MKIGKLAHTNSKGQVVLPKEYRDILGITSEVPLNIVPKFNGIFIQPIENVIPKQFGSKPTSTYMKVLQETKGRWGDIPRDSFENEELELSSTKENKKQW